jgi:FAD/FMN-containing dehydrogenase
MEVTATGRTGGIGALPRRVRVVATLGALYAVAVVLGSLPSFGYRHASGVIDLGHAVIPALLDLTDVRTAEYVWWLGTLPLEVFFVAIVVWVLVTGRGERLALCLFAMYALHWLCLHATTLPPPDRIVWHFPPGVVTLGKPFASDFWFSGHVANAFVIALATRGRRPWLRTLTWSGVVFETVLVLTTRTHYSIDVIGGLFVGYATHRLSLDFYPADASARSSPSRTWWSRPARWPPSAWPRPGASSRRPRRHGRSPAWFSRPRSRPSRAEPCLAFAPGPRPERARPGRSGCGAPDARRRRPRTHTEAAMLTRRHFLVTAGALGVTTATGRGAADDGAQWVDDVHARLNRTRVHSVVRPTSVAQVRRAIVQAGRDGRALSIAGGRHAMGGQQFGADTVLLDMRDMRRVLALDTERGVADVEAGIEWPELVSELARLQVGRQHSWSIVQKQTGADRFSIGGALAANVHGRGLRFRPIVQDVESFTLVNAAGRVIVCSRDANAELFRLVIGGYGLFGVVTSVRLRLAPRRKLRRVVEVRVTDGLDDAFAQRIAAGFEYGDFQFAIDPASDDFLRTGVFSCYRPVPDDTPVPAAQRELRVEDWGELLYLAHTDKRRAFELYRDHYLATDGQVYWSDEHQLGVYVDDYHREIDRRLGAHDPATEMITELYVPRPRLADFLAAMRDDFRRQGVDLIYGSVRLVERDDETVLAWAREPWACVVLNLHVVHTPDGLAHAADAFRRLIDLAAGRGGTYYLTYHHWATRAQVEACHPRLAECLRIKRAHDPEERFQSEWYRHHRAMFSA